MKNFKYTLNFFDTRSGRRHSQWGILNKCSEICGIFLMICTQEAVYLKFLETRVSEYCLPVHLTTLCLSNVFYS